MSDAQFAIVDGIGDARSLIFATWLKSYQANSAFVRHIPRDVFFRHHHDVIERLLERGATVKLATLPDDPSTVFGWSVTSPGAVHYVYVKPDFRRYGIATALLAHVKRPFTYSHSTYVTRDLHKHLDGCIYNPYEALYA